VPTHALTLTLPTLFSAGAMSCVVPGPTKREAVRRTLREPISEDCPATILRRHPRAILHVDMDAYGKE
jgi:glucosamine-6-phosphate deaminase